MQVNFARWILVLQCTDGPLSAITDIPGVHFWVPVHELSDTGWVIAF